MHGESIRAFLASPRRRLRLALLLAVAVVAFLSFVLFPARRVMVTADGRSVEVTSRETDTSEILAIAGIPPQVGDLVEHADGEVVVERAISVRVNIDGQALAWRTRARIIDDLLEEMGLRVSPHDLVVYNGVEVGLREELVPEEEITLRISRAVPISVSVNGWELILNTSRTTLADALADAGITLGPADKIAPAPQASVFAGMNVEIEHAKAINLQTGNGIHVLYTHAELLREALAEIGLLLEGGDRVEPSGETAITDGMEARLVRVSGTTIQEREPVLSRTVFKPAPDLTGSETRRVLGSDGVRVHEVRIVIEDGIEVERSVVGEFFDPEPVNTVIYYAAEAAEATGFPVGDLDVLDVKRMWATWYNAASSGKPATHPAYGITFSGVPLARGIVAIDPDVIPLGTRVFIPGYGFAVALDTGGGIVGDMIDLGYPDGAPVDWHTGWAEVFILAP